MEKSHFWCPQGSILGPILFNIFLADLFLLPLKTEMVNFADDNYPFCCSESIDCVIERLQIDSKLILSWFETNKLKANPDKFHLLLSDRSSDRSITIGQYNIQNSGCEKLLGVKIDSKLSFKEHVKTLCDTASNKLHALNRVARFMTVHQKRAIMRAFINSQFNYCPLVWIFCNRALNNRINRIHERSLRIVYNDPDSTFQELLNRDKSVSIHVRNLQSLAIEIYKVVHEIASEIMKSIFPLNRAKRYPTRNIFNINNIRTTKYGVESLSYFGPKIWELVPKDMKDIKSLHYLRKQSKIGYQEIVHVNYAQRM